MKQQLSILAAIVFVAVLGIANYAPAGGEKTEVEGAWKLTKGGKGAPTQLTFSGNKFVVNFAEDRVIKGTFKLNTEENPSWMDMTILSDPAEKYTGKVALCIYKFDADEFTWCASVPESKRRPQEFAEVMGDARLLLGTYKMDAK